MTSPEPHTPVGVAARLFSEGYMFDFFQSVRLLETFFAEGKGLSEPANIADEQIRFRPHSGLVFPATDVRSIELLQGTPPRALITATFMGLYGIGSPLPVYFYDSVATETEESKPLRDFLDMFNHRLYSLFYRSWRKYRLALQYSNPLSREKLVVRALSLAGLGTKRAVDDSVIDPIRLAGFAGSLAMRVHNAEGLQNLVAEFLGGVQVSVLENVSRWVTIPRRGCVGRNSGVPTVLGQTACIGEQVHDVAGKFCIVMGPSTLQQYLALLPGGASARLLQFLVRLYVRDTLAYDVQLKLITREIPVYRLGDQTLQLGLTTWLGKPRTETTSRTVVYH
jgi:type VI secretion system protein ImpH